MAAPNYPCSRCGTPLRWIPQYYQWFCDRCQAYAPGRQEDFFDSIARDFEVRETPPQPRCTVCGWNIRWVNEQNRWWCDRCQRYL